MRMLWARFDSEDRLGGVSWGNQALAGGVGVLVDKIWCMARADAVSSRGGGVKRCCVLSVLCVGFRPHNLSQAEPWVGVLKCSMSFARLYTAIWQGVCIP